MPKELHRLRTTLAGRWAALVLLLPVIAGTVAAQDTAPPARALVGATLIDGTGGPPVFDAVVLIRDGRIACAGSRQQCVIPPGTAVTDVRGKWIIPGLIDAHVHFSQTGWVTARPDAVDLRDRFPYPQVIADLEARPERFFRAYLCSGVTAVFDVGGYPWTWGLRERVASDSRAPRVAVAGPLLSTIDFWLNLPAERQFIYMADDSTVRHAVRYHAAFESDAIKVWYVMPPQPPDTARVQALVRAAAEEAKANGLRLIVHATGLWEAKDAVRAGADLLVHSIFEDPVDEEFLTLAQESGVVYTPTITVEEGYRDVYGGTLDDSRYPLDCVDADTRSFARPDAIPAERVRPRARSARAIARSERSVATALDNARRLHAAGVAIAVGTDAGNPGTFHGPSIHREMELLQQAGLSPMDVLVAATRNSAVAMGKEDEIGTVEVGKRADLVVLSRDPIADIRNARHIDWVVKDGDLHRPAELREP